jgi:hypothetical protein
VKDKYPIRYLVEPWNKPIDPDNKQRKSVIPGVTVSTNNYGYTDQILIMSVIVGEDGEESVLILDSESKGNIPTRRMLEICIQQCQHILDHHNPE